MPLLRFSSARTGYRPCAPGPADGGRPRGGGSTNGPGGARPEPGAPTPVARHGQAAPRHRARDGYALSGAVNGPSEPTRWRWYGRPPAPRPRGAPGRQVSRSGVAVGPGTSYGMAMTTPLVSSGLDVSQPRAPGPRGGYAAEAAEEAGDRPRARGQALEGEAGRPRESARVGRLGRWERAVDHGSGCVITPVCASRGVARRKWERDGERLRKRGRKEGWGCGVVPTEAVVHGVGVAVGSAGAGVATSVQRCGGACPTPGGIGGTTTGPPRRHAPARLLPGAAEPARGSRTRQASVATRPSGAKRQEPPEPGAGDVGEASDGATTAGITIGAHSEGERGARGTSSLD